MAGGVQEGGLHPSRVGEHGVLQVPGRRDHGVQGRDAAHWRQQPPVLLNGPALPLLRAILIPTAAARW